MIRLKSRHTTVPIRPPWRCMLASLLVILSVGCGPTDIRPPSFRDTGITAQNASKGRALLESAARAHGLAAWQQFRAAEVTLTDHWFDTLLRPFLMGWPHNDPSLRYSFLSGSLTGQIEFLSGPSKGMRWATHEGLSLEAAPGGPWGQTDAHEPTGKIGAFQYFFEFPFRIIEADVVAYVDTQSLDGKTYDRVFASWRSEEPQPDIDQYVVWIEQQEKRIEHVAFTYREKNRLVNAVVHPSDYRELQGVWIAFRRTATRGIDGVHKIHEYRLESVRFMKEVPGSLIDVVGLPLRSE